MIRVIIKDSMGRNHTCDYGYKYEKGDTIIKVELLEDKQVLKNTFVTEGSS